MKIYFAPMQSVTDAPYRAAHADSFGGIAKYFTPFISPTQHTNLTNKEMRDIAPEANAGLPVVPQILTRDAEHFLFAANLLADLGWKEINLNAGCPAGTVTAKGKGSGLLANLTAFELLLDEIYARSPLPVSIKTRLGWTDPEESVSLMELINQYPVPELILHARTRTEFYGGHVHTEIFDAVLQTAKMPVIYNGDLFDVPDCESFLASHDGIEGIMIGRGLASNPAIARALNGGSEITLSELAAFHERLLHIYEERFSPTGTLGRMREIGKFTVCCFQDARKIMKAIQKASSMRAYLEATETLFTHCPLREHPGFISDGSRAGHAAAWVPPEF